MSRFCRIVILKDLFTLFRETCVFSRPRHYWDEQYDLRRLSDSQLILLQQSLQFYFG